MINVKVLKGLSSDLLLLLAQYKDTLNTLMYLYTVLLVNFRRREVGQNI